MGAVDGGVMWEQLTSSPVSLERLSMCTMVGGSNGDNITTLTIPFNVWDSSISLPKEASLTCVTQTSLSYMIISHFSPSTFCNYAENQGKFCHLDRNLEERLFYLKLQRVFTWVWAAGVRNLCTGGKQQQRTSVSSLKCVKGA